MNLNPEYRAERIKNDNIIDFVNMHNEIFKGKITIDDQRKKLNTIPSAGIENLGYIIYHLNGEPVTFNGVYPLYACINNKKVLVSQSGDTMTKPDHIGLGLIISAAELTYKLSEQNNVKGVFGFPSRPAYPTLKKKLDWKFNDTLKRYRFFVPTVPLGILALKIKFINSIYLWWVRIVLSFYKKSGNFESSIIANGQDGVCRSEEFWKYKMAANNNFSIWIGKTRVVFKANGNLCIGDLNVDDKSEIIPILRKLKLLAFLTGNIYIYFNVSPGTVLDEKLSPIKQSTKSLPIGFLNLSGEIDISTLKFTYFDFDTF